MENKYKICSVCNIEKPVADFYLRSRHERSGRCKVPHQHLCKECLKRRRKAYRADPVNRQREYDLRKIAYHKNLTLSRKHARQNNLRRFKGMDHLKYEKLNQLQGGLCAICGKPETSVLRGKVKPLGVDHCHETNVIRGLLCSNCNSALGLFKDDIYILQLALNYLLTPVVHPIENL